MGPPGRERECATIDRLLADACRGDSRALVIRGEVGIGKTTLLEYAADHADAMTVLRCAGVEAESDLVFAGVYGLVRPILGHLPDIAGTQADALAAALGMAPSAGSDRFLVSAALLSLIAAAAEVRPVLCLADDAQWLDAPSARALVFTARRLRAERVAMLFGARDGDPSRFDAPGIRELVLTGLDDESAAALLAGHARGAAPTVRERLLTAAEGNPLALLELPAG